MTERYRATVGYSLAASGILGETWLTGVKVATHLETAVAIVLMWLGSIALATTVRYQAGAQHSRIYKYSIILGLSVLMTLAFIAIYMLIIGVLFAMLLFGIH